MNRKFLASILYIILITSVSIVTAQDACPQIVAQALQSLGDNCETIGRNSACYGYDLVTAEFSEDVADDFFSQPADTSALSILETIQTAEMDTALAQWGVAVMSVQANIPNSVPGQAVRFVLLGDVEVENAVEPDQLFESVDPIEVALTDSANIRSGAGLSFNVIGGVPAGTSLALDGQSADGVWYRTVFNDRIGWVFGELLDNVDALADLPVIDGQQRSTMQAFYLRTGFGEPTCEEAPDDTLVVQSPEGIQIDLTVNGADINIGSTIAMRILPPGDIIEFTVIDGKLTIKGGNPDGSDLIVYENYRTTACLTEPDNLGVDGNSNDRLIGCDYTEPEFVPDLDLGNAFCVLEGVTTFNYGVDLVCPGEPVEEVIIVETEEPSEPEPDPTRDINLCAVGNAWGDGRCKTDYDWQAGYYYGLLEEGEIVIDDIPGPYYATATPQPTATPKPKKEKKEEAPEFCSDFDGEGWPVYKISTEEFIEYAEDDPGFPSCDFEETPL